MFDDSGQNAPDLGSVGEDETSYEVYTPLFENPTKESLETSGTTPMENITSLR